MAHVDPRSYLAMKRQGRSVRAGGRGVTWSGLPGPVSCGLETCFRAAPSGWSCGLHPIERKYWMDTTYDRLDRMKLVELVREVGYGIDEDGLAETTRSELIDLLVSTQVSAKYERRRPAMTTTCVGRCPGRFRNGSSTRTSAVCMSGWKTIGSRRDGRWRPDGAPGTLRARLGQVT